eukprot:15439373-Alexandrium_andersonii.AAC.1
MSASLVGSEMCIRDRAEPTLDSAQPAWGIGLTTENAAPRPSPTGGRRRISDGGGLQLPAQPLRATFWF